MIRIAKVKERYGWFGNMSPFPVLFEGQHWRTTEALFQALRFENEEIKKLIREEKSPMGAKFKSKRYKHSMVVKPMSEQDVRNMKLVLSLKLEQHIFIRDSLLETNDQLIFEDVSNRRGARHLFWGMKMENGAWLGQNVLGKLWMELREEYLTNS